MTNRRQPATEQRAMHVALAALRRDAQGVAMLLGNMPQAEALRVASVALGAISELALTAPQTNIDNTIKALNHIAGR